MYKNSSGYSDPTAGAAIGHVMRSERRKHRKRTAYQKVKKIYVASKYAGDVAANVEKAVWFRRF